MSPTIIVNDQSQWRVKAINNKMTSIELANTYGGNVSDYLVKYNQLLRKKIVAVKLGDDPVVTRIAKQTRSEKFAEMFASTIKEYKTKMFKEKSNIAFYQLALQTR